MLSKDYCSLYKPVVNLAIYSGNKLAFVQKNKHLGKICLMKWLIGVMSVTITCSAIFAQNVGIGTNTPQASAQLDVSSTTKGLLAPRMTTAQRNAIASPAKGLLVYDTNINELYQYNGSGWVIVGGSGGFALPFQGAINSANAGFDITNLGAGNAIDATGTTGAGVYGRSGVQASGLAGVVGLNTHPTGGYGVLGIAQATNSSGVYGSSNSGTGVTGYSNTKYGVKGSTISGTGLYGSSSTGYGLESVGKLKISGGNTNPAEGAVLTSIDEGGNAVWKKRKVGFLVQNRNTNLDQFPAGVSTTVHLFNEAYDYGNNYSLYTGSSPSFGNSVFTAPVAGLYHFDAGLRIVNGSYHVIEAAQLKLSIIRSGVGKIEYVEGFSHAVYYEDGSGINKSIVRARLSRDVKLIAGDLVFLELYHEQTLGNTILWGISTEQYFSGHLVFED